VFGLAIWLRARGTRRHDLKITSNTSI
jgi:hypothetical protein